MSVDGESMENGGFVWDSREPGAAALREAMGTFPTGVTVLTSGHGEAAEGMTANAVISVSLDPVLFLVSVHRETRISPRIKECGYYAVSLLAANQEGLSRLFASPERSSGLSAVHSLGGGYGRTGAPLAAGALAAIECELEAAYPGGDHELFLGRVVAVHLGDARRGPLLFHDGGYPPLYSSGTRTGQESQDNAFVDSVRGFDARLSGRAGRKGRRGGRGG
ncbi:flavin reductase family protein [Rubrobacter aplysinae]|uniref:flavin reductase family protein n=1 Tax=Rubrobacter aplysinae TaxID=909625 RepID=UPI001910305B|nr:flavin reductase family protein [Rubrobacter aplysinae]